MERKRKSHKSEFDDLIKKVKDLRKKYNLKELIDYKKYSEFMDSKVVRSPRTHTPIDYITDEELKLINKKGITDLTAYVPTFKDTKKHFDFVEKLYSQLRIKHSNDVLIKELGNSEEGVILLFTTNWYERFETLEKEIKRC